MRRLADCMDMRKLRSWFVVISASVLLSMVAAEEPPSSPGEAPAKAPAERASRFIDPEDGQFDLSYFLENPRGFLPIPIVITEPAVGYGGGVAGMFFQCPTPSLNVPGVVRERPVMAAKHRTPDRCGRPLNCAFRSSGLELPVCVVLLPFDRRPRTPARDPEATSAVLISSAQSSRSALPDPS